MKSFFDIDSLYAYKDQLPLTKEVMEEGGDLLLNIGLVALIIVVQLLFIKATYWLFRRWKFKLTRIVLRRVKPLVFKDYEVLNIHRQGIAFLQTYRLLRIAIVVMQLLVSIPMMFYVFPETKKFVLTVLSYIWNPTKDIFWSVVGYLPNVFKIGVIIVCIHYIVQAFQVAQW